MNLATTVKLPYLAGDSHDRRSYFGRPTCQSVVYNPSTPERARIYTLPGFQMGISLRSGAADAAVKMFGAHTCTPAEFGHWEKVVVTR